VVRPISFLKYQALCSASVQTIIQLTLSHLSGVSLSCGNWNAGSTKGERVSASLDVATRPDLPYLLWTRSVVNVMPGPRWWRDVKIQLCMSGSRLFIFDLRLYTFVVTCITFLCTIQLEHFFPSLCSLQQIP
jgi:hypothetical protein